MKSIQFFLLAFLMIMASASLFAGDPVKPGTPAKTAESKEPEQSYVWIKYSCASYASDPRDVEMVTGALTPTVASPRPCYRMYNWQPGATIMTGPISCQQINPFQECTTPPGGGGGNICAVRYLTSEIEGIGGGNTNIRPKVGITFTGRDYRTCGSIYPDPPCTSVVYSPCSNSWPWNTNP